MHVFFPGIDALNSDCFCFSLDRDALARALGAELGTPGLAALMHERCPTLFAAQPVFVAPQHLQRMTQVVRAVESVVALPAYREQVLASAPRRSPACPPRAARAACSSATTSISTRAGSG